MFALLDVLSSFQPMLPDQLVYVPGTLLILACSSVCCAYLGPGEAIQYGGIPMLLQLLLQDGCLPHKVDAITIGGASAINTGGSRPLYALPHVSRASSEKQGLQTCHRGSSCYSKGQP